MKEFEAELRVRNNRLKERRLALGLSAPALAKASGVSYTTYVALESLLHERQAQPTMIKIHGVIHGTTVNGPGIRTAIWTQGCTIGCPGCWNPETCGATGGTTWHADELVEAVLLDAPDRTQGITLSGGEPFQQAEAAAVLVYGIKRRRPAWDVFVWTGFVLGDLVIRAKTEPDIAALLRQIDILVDGPYVAAHQTSNKLWCGSTNQRVRPLSQRGVRLIIAAGIARAVGEPDEFEIVARPDGTVVGTGFPPPKAVKVIRR